MCTQVRAVATRDQSRSEALEHEPTGAQSSVVKGVALTAHRDDEAHA